MTDLKLQVRRLQRELEAVRKNEADASRVLVLENLLEDANRMKARYEADYLAAHREKLMLQANGPTCHRGDRSRWTNASMQAIGGADRGPIVGEHNVNPPRGGSLYGPRTEQLRFA